MGGQTIYIVLLIIAAVFLCIAVAFPTYELISRKYWQHPGSVASSVPSPKPAAPAPAPAPAAPAAPAPAPAPTPEAPPVPEPAPAPTATP